MEQFRRLAAHLPLPLTLAFRYPRELLFVTGYRSFDKPKPSVVFFTVGKCASVFMRRLLAEINRRHLGLTPLNLAAYWFDARSEPFYTCLRERSRDLLCDRGILYAPLREYADVSHLEQARIIGMLRDPRDKIVSGYYSASVSHRAPVNRSRRDSFADRRKQLQALTIDEYAVRQEGRVKRIYAGYRQHLDRARVLTYEDMWSDFDAWALRLGKLLGVDLSAAEIQRYRRLAGVDEARREDAGSHRRRGTPGDYKNKLSPAVADRLTEAFAEDLRWLYGDG